MKNSIIIYFSFILFLLSSCAKVNNSFPNTNPAFLAYFTRTIQAGNPLVAISDTIFVGQNDTFGITIQTGLPANTTYALTYPQNSIPSFKLLNSTNSYSNTINNIASGASTFIFGGNNNISSNRLVDSVGVKSIVFNMTSSSNNQTIPMTISLIIRNTFTYNASITSKTVSKTTISDSINLSTINILNNSDYNYSVVFYKDTVTSNNKSYNPGDTISITPTPNALNPNLSNKIITFNPSNYAIGSDTLTFTIKNTKSKSGDSTVISLPILITAQ